MAITLDAIREQYRYNLMSMEKMLAKATETGRKVRGYTAAQLEDHVTEWRRIVALPDDELAAYWRGLFDKLRAEQSARRALAES